MVAASRFGTLDAELRVPPDAALGSYRLKAELRRDGTWTKVAEASYAVAEYRPPEFAVEATTPPAPLFAGDSMRVAIAARYLFGAPMGRATLSWSLRREPAWIWENDIPGLDWHWTVGGGGWWEEDQGERASVLESGQDSLDLAGRRNLAAAVPAPPAGKPVRVTLAATVMDANRQTVTASASALVHPSEFYIAARTENDDYVLKAGDPLGVRLLAVRPDGQHVAGVDIRGALVRREWHRVRRIRGDAASEVGEWVADTVGTCGVRSAGDPVRCTVTPTQGGSYTLVFTASDSKGRPAKTSLWRWVSGPGFVPWEDETKLKMDLVADRPRYSVGDTAVVLVASPFTDAEAWVTVERERVIEQRRLKLTSGSTALRFPITEAFVPNAFVSVIVVRGRSARPGPLDDPGRPTLRVGYAELRVTPERKRLVVDVKPLKDEYRPGDSARVAIHVRDAAGHGVASEVTLWAVDEGVLSLTGYKTPDPLDLMYGERGLGLRLGSNLSTVAPQIPEGMKGGRAPGGGGGNDVNGILRSRFRPTAFFLATVQTDPNGDAVAAGELPDNLTTFRVMAVAVTAGDRYGKGQAPLLSTRPLVARPALPRFVREGDRFKAGVVVNQRAGGTPKVKVTAQGTGIALEGSKSQEAKLEAGRGAELRFGWRALPGDSAAFRFDASGAGDADAVRVAIPVKPPY
ncbi:MAG TPA: alpha-2-macroglobulin family protein, partial [Longimicrobiales bacterium]